MAREFPDWMMEKYTVNSDSAEAEKAAEPAPSPKQDLYRTFLNLEMGDSQQERDYLSGAARESTKVKTDPILFRRMAEKYAMPVNEDPSDILLNEPEIAGPFSSPPVRKPTVELQMQGIPVFTDQNSLEKVVAEAPAASSPVSFGRTFDRERRKGKEEFSYEGKLFNTRKKGESDDDWAKGLGIVTPKQKSIPPLEQSLPAVGAGPKVVDDTRVMDMVKRHEGTLEMLRKLGHVDDQGMHHAYEDKKGNLTIGYGHLLDPGEKMRSITEAEAQALFEKDYAEHKAAAEQIPGYGKAGPARQAALIDLTFNMGPDWHKEFDGFSAAFLAGDYNLAADELMYTDPTAAKPKYSDWFKDVELRGPEIVEMMRSGAVN